MTVERMVGTKADSLAALMVAEKVARMVGCWVDWRVVSLADRKEHHSADRSAERKVVLKVA